MNTQQTTETRIERDYLPEVRDLLARLVLAGFALHSLDNGGDELACGTKSTFGRYVEESTACDECHLWVTRADCANGRPLAVYLVLGNEPGVVCADYVCVAELERVIVAHSDAWEGTEQRTRTVRG